jgi:hypothetical protein
MIHPNIHPNRIKPSVSEIFWYYFGIFHIYLISDTDIGRFIGNHLEIEHFIVEKTAKYKF